MTWSDLLPLFAQSGIVGVLSWVAYHLHRDAVRAHQQRADDWQKQAADWKEATRLANVRADERDAQLVRVVAAVTAKTTTSEAS